MFERVEPARRWPWLCLEEGKVPPRPPLVSTGRGLREHIRFLVPWCKDCVRSAGFVSFRSNLGTCLLITGSTTISFFFAEKLWWLFFLCGGGSVPGFFYLYTNRLYNDYYYKALNKRDTLYAIIQM